MKMLGVTNFLQTCNSTALTPISHHLFTSTPSIPYKSRKSNSNACSNVLFLQVRNGVFVSAVKKQKRGSKKLLELAAFDELGDEEDEEEDEEEEGMIIPLSGMKEWFEKKPSGFGEGKEYDTSLEEKLFEELEQSRKAQIANINKLKSNPSMGSSKKEQQATKVPEAIPSGVCVRVGNLPKKKNIQRDLQLVFKGFPAIVNISPAVSGNKKTRDPVCKGFAFVYLGSAEAANRFVETYSKKSIPFGKIQKQITCEIKDASKSSDPVSRHSASHMSTAGQRLPRMEPISEADSDVANLSLESKEVTLPEESGVQGQQFISATSEASEEGTSDVQSQQFVSATYDEIEEGTPDESGVQSHQLISPTSEATNKEGIAHMNLSETDDFEKTTMLTAAGKPESLPSKQHKKKQNLKKKQTVKVKLSIPGSTKRLRVKEKAVLAGVFSKYGSKRSPALTK